MDPEATIDQIYNALTDEDFEESQQAARDLIDWMDGGGFKPGTLIVQPILEECIRAHAANGTHGDRIQTLLDGQPSADQRALHDAQIQDDISAMMPDGEN